MRALQTQIREESQKYKDREVVTVYIGGGTPTSVAYSLLVEVLNCLREEFHLKEDAEISMEANPGTITKEALLAYRKTGINRLSIGLQSAKNEELKRLGRIHSFEDFLQTYEWARTAGFTNLNVDVMAALPGQCLSDYEETLRAVIALKPEHISAYSLIVEEGTPFYEKYGEEKAEQERTGVKQAHLPSEEEERAMVELTDRLLEENGYVHYEISNYARPGFTCAHNLVYWKCEDYLGLGLGAASLVGEKRFCNTAQLSEYLKEPCKLEEEQILNEFEQIEEYMFLGLRLYEGVSVPAFKERFKKSPYTLYRNIIGKHVKDGLLSADERTGERIVLTPKGFCYANYVMADFLLSDEGGKALSN